MVMNRTIRMIFNNLREETLSQSCLLIQIFFFKLNRSQLNTSVYLYCGAQTNDFSSLTAVCDA